MPKFDTAVTVIADVQKLMDEIEDDASFANLIKLKTMIRKLEMCTIRKSFTTEACMEKRILNGVLLALHFYKFRLRTALCTRLEIPTHNVS